MKSIHAGALFLSLCVLFPHLNRAEDKILLYYNDRPPYLIPAADGSATGLTATPAGNAFRAAGIPFTWVKVPTNRQLLNIKSNNGMHCGVGWFKNPEREQFAKFTKAIYRDMPTIALANIAFQTKPGAKLTEVLAGKDLRVLAKDNFSYGPLIDGLLSKLKPTILRTTNENSFMVEMIRLDRADLMFVAEEEANFLAEEAGSSIDEFHLIKFQDMPPGEKRYIMCSKQVPDQIIDRLNKGIDFE